MHATQAKGWKARFKRVTVFAALACCLPMGAVVAQEAGGVRAIEVVREEGSMVSEGHHLLSMEAVYKGIFEAEKRRLKMAEPERDMPRSLIDDWGIQVISANSTADGVFLDFRFRVVDPEKANVLFDSRIKPYLESEEDGVKLGVPSAAKIGYLRTTNRGHNILAGKIYSIMFSNPGLHVKADDRVSIVAGEFRVPHIKVREYVDRRFVRR